MKSRIIEKIQEMDPGRTSKADAEKMFQTVTMALRHVVEIDGEARVPGFGTFKKKHREGRTVRNPRTGETVNTSAKDVITFKQSKAS